MVDLTERVMQKKRRAAKPTGWKQILERLGFETYEQYLAGELWQRIRVQVLKRDGYRCGCCGGRADQVHHRSYGWATMSGEKVEKLISLCRKCHHHAHFDGKLRINSAAEWESRLADRFKKNLHDRGATPFALKKKRRKNCGTTRQKPPHNACRGCLRNAAPKNRDLCRKCRREGVVPTPLIQKRGRSRNPASGTRAKRRATTNTKTPTQQRLPADKRAAIVSGFLANPRF